MSLTLLSRGKVRFRMDQECRFHTLLGNFFKLQVLSLFFKQVKHVPNSNLLYQNAPYFGADFKHQNSTGGKSVYMETCANETFLWSHEYWFSFSMVEVHWFNSWHMAWFGTSERKVELCGSHTVTVSLTTLRPARRFYDRPLCSQK